MHHRVLGEVARRRADRAADLPLRAVRLDFVQHRRSLQGAWPTRLLTRLAIVRLALAVPALWGSRRARRQRHRGRMGAGRDRASAAIELAVARRVFGLPVGQRSRACCRSPRPARWRSQCARCPRSPRPARPARLSVAIGALVYALVLSFARQFVVRRPGAVLGRARPAHPSEGAHLRSPRLSRLALPEALGDLHPRRDLALDGAAGTRWSCSRWSLSADRTRAAPLVSLRASPLWLARPAAWLARAPRSWSRSGRGAVRAPPVAELFARSILAVAFGSLYALLMQRRGVEHVHAHWATHPALGAWAIPRLTGLPYSFTAHADDLFVQQTMLAQKARAAFVVAISEYNRRWSRSVGGGRGADRGGALRCRPQTSASRCRPEPGGGPSGSPASRASRRRRARGSERGLRDTAPRCRSPLRPRRRRPRSRVALARDAAGLGDRVALHGPQPRERALALIAAATSWCCRVSSPDGRRDGIPIALMEAMALARPVVASASLGHPRARRGRALGAAGRSRRSGALADALAQIHRDPAGAARSRERRPVECGSLRSRRNVAALQRLFDAARKDALPYAPIASGIALQVGPARHGMIGASLRCSGGGRVDLWTYAGFPLVLALRALRARPPRDAAAPPRVSFVIVAHNEAEVDAKLANLERSTTPRSAPGDLRVGRLGRRHQRGRVASPAPRPRSSCPSAASGRTPR